MSKSNYHILIVDDQAEFHRDMRVALGDHYEFDGAINEKQFLNKLENNQGKSYDLVLLDLKLDEKQDIQTGLNLIPHVKQNYPNIPIIVVTVEGNVAVVVEALNSGATHYLHKEQLDFAIWDTVFQSVIEKARETNHLKAEVSRYRAKESAEHPFIGESPQIREIKKSLQVVSQRPDITVLILGETGVGKEVAARYLHSHGVRRNKPFVGVNLSAIQKTLLESSLFGARKGGFTGSTRDLKGHFEQANEGILMLDEIGDIDANIQIKLLRFLETRLIRPIGSDEDIQLNVQIIAATHRNLREEIRKENFREDLYQRLKMFVIDIPPLRERKEDIPLIIEHYLKKHALGLDVLEKEVMDRLLQYNWRGNIRELTNTVDSMLIKKDIAGKRKVDPECLPSEIVTDQLSLTGINRKIDQPSASSDFDEHAYLSAEAKKALIDLKAIDRALAAKNGKKGDVAKMLHYGSSDNLRYRIETLWHKFPDLFNEFEWIKKKYRKIVN